MIVAIEEGENSLKKALVSAGHTPVYLYRYKGVIDAAVYRQKSLTENAFYAGNYNNKNSGIFIIWANDLTNSQVLEMLNKKTSDGQCIF